MPLRRNRLAAEKLEDRCLLAADPLVFDPDEVAWNSIRNYSQDAWVDYFNENKDEFIPTDVEVDVVNGEVKFGATWQRNLDNRAWEQWHLLTSDQFGDKWQDLNSRGFRLVDQEAYTVGGRLRYSGLWVENTEKYKWASYRNLSSEAFSEKFEELKDDHIIIDVEAYTSGARTLYAMVWVENREGLAWAEHRNMTQAQFESRFDQYKDQYRVLDVESYRRNGQQQYAATWVENENNRGWFTYYGMTSTGWVNRWNQMLDRGYRPIDYEVYDTPNGKRYAGVWRQNSDRPNWQYRDEVDALAEDWVEEYDVPGVGVAIIQDGETRYRAGFGFQDVDAKRWYSSRTINRLASVSKSVAGVLAMDLVEDGLLDLDRTTRSYLPDIPAHHTHTLRQLLSVRSGVGHYAELGSPARSAQFDTAENAMSFFIDEDLVMDPGSDCDYSTHGYTVLAAAMERATNQSISDLVEARITDGVGLSTLRAEDRSISNSYRSAVYNSSGAERTADNISWKVLGGGLESSTYDLARFGRELLQGDIISEASMNELWTVPEPTPCTDYSNFALGASRRTTDGNRVVQMTGSQLGAGTVLRMYPEHQVVIAVTSNLQGADAWELAVDIGAMIIPVDSTRDDSMEPNDSASVAHRIHLDRANRWSSNGLQKDNDYFVLDVPKSMQLAFDLQFVHALGNIDMELRNANDQRIAFSHSTTDKERMTQRLQAGTYFVKIYGENRGNLYTLSIYEEKTDLPGDANHDGAVNFADFLIVSGNFGSGRASFEQGDFNGDGFVNFADFLILSGNFGTTAVIVT